MLISLNWIRDFVDLPTSLDPRELAERFTRTTAEVDDVRPVEVGASGLIVAGVREVVELPGPRNLLAVTLDIGGGCSASTVSAAPGLRAGAKLVYAPVGSRVAAFGEIRESTVAGRTSSGMILPGEALGVPLAAQEAIAVDHAYQLGDTLESGLFEDWVIEVDNKSITHRPDLWGHYGVAREIAAILGVPLKSYPVVAQDELTDRSKPTIPIDIAEPLACPRYVALRFEGVPIQPAPLWMQLRLGHVGMRPISGLVDLTNYIMAELGQPMHAFDAAKVERIEVDHAGAGETFRTLDGVERVLAERDLMIRSAGRSIALAGVMGGLDTEVSDTTTSLLLESANFEPSGIRRTAVRLGLRTDASARFEKSLDPSHAVLGVQRFVHLARPMYPKLRITSALSDAFPTKPSPVTVCVRASHVTRAMGREVATDEIERFLTPLGFSVTSDDGGVTVGVPSFRATGDVSIEVDVIEEIARRIGYDHIPPAMPRVTVRRFEPNAMHELEQRTLEDFTTAHGYHEIHGYLWYDDAWLTKLRLDPGPCVELRNPAAEGLHRLRRSIMPGMLAATAKNRFHFAAVSLLEVGSVFEPHEGNDREFRHLGLLSARRGKGRGGELFDSVKGTIEAWAWRRFGRSAGFAPAVVDPARPWEHRDRTAAIVIGDRDIGRVSVIDLTLRRAMDEHLSAWSMAWAELRLTGLEALDRTVETIESIPEFPRVEMDLSVLVPRSTRYAEVAEKLGSFEHALLKRLRFVTAYEGESTGADRRSLTFRAVIGDDTRTLVDADANAFRAAFESHLTDCGFEIKQ